MAYIRDYAEPEASFVFTNMLTDGPGDRRMFRRIERLAKHRGATFVPVWLSCSGTAMRKRKGRPDRRERMKDVGVTNIRYWLDEFVEIRMEYRNELRLDTTDSPAKETAAKIIHHARRCSKRL